MNWRTHLHVCQVRVTGVYYRDNIIKPLVVAPAAAHGNDFIFKNDNVRAHRAHGILNHLQTHGIKTFHGMQCHQTSHQSNMYGTCLGG